ncbi:hypothetical protein CHS0354_040231 [Potamilus streckersoni]|uniref:Uncharacterized protein n=1 Tax=Potamilus streckersoni TaxID=2493646 RepID=A0AAE0VPB5_9BIVA|nr:hypothetical protein CHS0354_040231 [Potamilus streckersoni]
MKHFVLFLYYSIKPIFIGIFIVDYRCKPNSVRRGWSPNVEGFVQASKEILEVMSFEACAAEADTRTAVAFQYTKKTKQCILLLENMTDLIWINNKDYMIQMCAEGYRRHVDEIDYVYDAPSLIMSANLIYGTVLSNLREEVITFSNAATCILDLYLVYLDVVCGSSQLIVERRSYIRKSTDYWCNLNRPVINESRRIMPRANMTITFRSYPLSDQLRQEGFEFRYVYSGYFYSDH